MSDLRYLEPRSASLVGLPSPMDSTLVPSMLLALLHVIQCFLPLSPQRHLCWIAL
jgi:hypothetical protein